MIELDTIKELFKQSIDESDNMSEAVQRLFGKVYDKGKEDVFKQITDEIRQIVDEETKHDEKWARGLHYALKIIDKHTN